MNHLRDALLRFVKAGMKTKAMLDLYQGLGLDDANVFEIWSEILSGIYDILGEKTASFEESVTARGMTEKNLTDERRAELLANEYRNNHPIFTMPKPHILERQDVRQMTKENGGYMTPEGDWQ